MNLSLISKILRKYPVLVVSGLIVPLTLVLISMRAPKLQEYQDEKSKLEKRWREIGLNKDRSTSLDEDARKIEEGVAQIQSRLMNVEAVAANYEVFYEIEAKAGITLSNFTIGMPFDGAGLSLPKNKLNHFSAVPCQIGISGTLPQILKFLDLLDRQEFIIRMDLLNVRNGSQVVSASDKEETLFASMRCYVLAAKDEQ